MPIRVGNPKFNVVDAVECKSCEYEEVRHWNEIDFSAFVPDWIGYEGVRIKNSGTGVGLSVVWFGKNLGIAGGPVRPVGHSLRRTCV